MSQKTQDENAEKTAATATPTEMGVAYTREGDAPGSEQLGVTDPASSMNDSTLSAARQKAFAMIQELQAKVDEIKMAAAARGDNPPDIDVSALSQDPTGLSGQDLALLQQELDKVEQTVAGEQGKQMLQTAGAATGFAAALAAIGGSEGMLAEMGLTGGTEASPADLGTNMRNGLDGVGIRQQQSGPAIPV